MSNAILAFLNQKDETKIEDFISPLIFKTHFIYAYTYLDKSGAAFSSTQGNYNSVYTEGTIVQSSCRFNLEKPEASDFRIYALEQTLGSKFNDDAKIADFYDSMRTYPFRIESTAVLSAFD